MYVNIPPNHPWGFLARPPRQDIDIIPGNLHQVYFTINGGTNSVSGLLVDSDGRPLIDYPVSCRYWKEKWELSPGESAYGISGNNMVTMTDENGRYCFSRLSNGRVKLYFTPGYSPWEEFGEKVYAGYVDQMEINLSGGLSVEAPPTIVWLARPFYLEGIIVPGGVNLKRVKVKVTMSQRELPREFDSLHTPPFREDKLKVGKDGTFKWRCETPHNEVIFVITYPDGEKKLVKVTPTPGTRELQVFL